MIFDPWERLFHPQWVATPILRTPGLVGKGTFYQVLSLISPCEGENIMECMYPPSLSSINEYPKMSTVYVDYIFFIQSPKNPSWVSGLIHSLTLVNTVTNEDGCAGVSMVFSHISLGMHPAVGEMNHTVVLLLVFLEVSTLISTNLILLSPVLHKNFQCSFLMASC